MQTYTKEGRFGITSDQIKAENPNTSFPQYLQPEDIEPLGYFPVADIAPAYDAATQYLVEGEPILANGEWQKAYTVTNYTQAELDAQAAAKAAAELAAAKALVPQSVSPRQIRQALTRFGIRGNVEAAIAAADQDTKDWYEFATAFDRTNPMVDALATGLGVTEEQLDQLWTLAGTL